MPGLRTSNYSFPADGKTATPAVFRGTVTRFMALARSIADNGVRTPPILDVKAFVVSFYIAEYELNSWSGRADLKRPASRDRRPLAQLTTAHSLRCRAKTWGARDRQFKEFAQILSFSS